MKTNMLLTIEKPWPSFNTNTVLQISHICRVDLCFKFVVEVRDLIEYYFHRVKSFVWGTAVNVVQNIMLTIFEKISNTTLLIYIRAF